MDGWSLVFMDVAAGNCLDNVDDSGGPNDVLEGKVPKGYTLVAILGLGGGMPEVTFTIPAQ